MARDPGIEQILLVDDNPTNLQVLFKTLEGSGYRLLAARDGEAALYTAKRAHPALILLDVMMPGMDGFEVCERLKADPETADIAVIFLSALTDSQSKVHGLAIGGVDYIAKPFQSDEVLARVRTHVKIQRLERALARRNSELEDENQRILNAVEEGIFGLDVEGRISSMNAQASALTGWPAADAIGENFSLLKLFPEETLNQALMLLCQGGVSLRKESTDLIMHNGMVAKIALSGTPRKDGGAVLVLRDISEWLQSQVALGQAREELDSQRQHLAHIERLSTGGEMAAGIAHEVNQPLTAVTNYARVAQRLLSDLPEDRREKMDDVLSKIAVQAERAAAVIQRMRSYVKKPTGVREELDLNNVLKDVIALAEVDSRVNGIDVNLIVADDLANIFADEVQFQQVALNLIRNAIEATVNADNKDAVEVRTYMQNAMVCFSVSDCGGGLLPEIEAQLFSPFVTSKEGGMGIGLSVCQSIMQSHGGDIRHQHNAKGGAIFLCEFPAH